MARRVEINNEDYSVSIEFHTEACDEPQWYKVLPDCIKTLKALGYNSEYFDEIEAECEYKEFSVVNLNDEE